MIKIDTESSFLFHTFLSLCKPWLLHYPQCNLATEWHHWRRSVRLHPASSAATKRLCTTIFTYGVTLPKICKTHFKVLKKKRWCFPLNPQRLTLELWWPKTGCRLRIRVEITQNTLASHSMFTSVLQQIAIIRQSLNVPTGKFVLQFHRR